MNHLEKVLSPAVVGTTVSTGSYTTTAELEMAVASLELSHTGLLAVLWFDNAVTTGYVDRGLHAAPSADVDLDHLLEARLFNADVELHVWRMPSGSYGWRLRSDGEGSKVETLTATQYLWGTTAIALADGWSVLSEDRGFTLAVPFQIPAGAVDTQHRLAVTVRLYVGFNDDHQAGYVDDRFMAFMAFAGTDREVALCRTEG